MPIETVIPVCAWCKKLRTKENRWLSSETFYEEEEINTNDLDNFSHGICPDCVKIVFPEFVSTLIPS